MARLTETRAHRSKLPQSGQSFIWCSEVKGFGARLTGAGARSYVVQCVWAGKETRITLGPVGVLPFEGPANAPGALNLALAALNAARRGEDPRLAIGQLARPEGVTIDDVWRAYAAAGHPKLKGVGRKRPSTIRADGSRYQFWVKPHFGRQAVDKIDTATVQRWLDGIPTEGQRAHTLVLLKGLLSFAGSRGLTKPNRIAISASPSKELQNFYTPAELARLDAALVALIEERPAQILPFSALRLLIMTGARLAEVLDAQWPSIDLEKGVLSLTRHKGGENRRDVLLAPAAVEVLRRLPRSTSAFVFFSDSKSGRLVDLQRPWKATTSRAEVPRLRLHDLRHSFASTAIREGVPIFTVGKLLGHKRAETTQRYSHLSQDTAREALERIAKAIRGAG